MSWAVTIGLLSATLLGLVLAVTRRRRANKIIGKSVPWPEESVSVWRRRR